MPGVEAVELTPAQRRVVDDLLALGRPRPHFDPGLATALASQLEAGLASFAPGPGESRLWVAKRVLGLVHTCEAHYLATEAGPGFSWTLDTVQGQVAHRAMELMLSVRGQPVPLDLVDYTLTRLSEGDDGLGHFVRSLGPLDAAELRGLASRQVSAFVECWPRLRAQWQPRTEAAIRYELCGGQVVLSGKPDLALGMARGTEARVLFVDLKTGGRYSHQLDDLRFYALVQTLKLGVPPFRVATYYLDSATFWAEDVTVETLEIALRRTVDGVRTIATLRRGDRPPTITPGPACTWCPARTTCDGPRLRAAD